MPRIVTKLVPVVLGVTLAAAVPTAAAQEQDQAPLVFRSRVDLATVNVSILDGEQPAYGIGPDDIRVLEDGVERQVAFVLRPEDAPLDVAIVLDASESMARTGAPDHALRLLDGLQADDCVLFLPFADGIRERLWAAPDDPRLRQAIENTHTRGATRLYDALVTALAEMFLRTQDPEIVAGFRPETTLIQPFDAFRFRPVYAFMYRAARLPSPDTACRQPDGRPRRRAILAVTDGLETAGAVSAIDALRAGWATETPIYVLSVKHRGDGERLLMDERLWQRKAVELGPGLNIDPLLALLDYNVDAERIAELLDHNLEAIAGTSGGRVFWDNSYRGSFEHALDWLRAYHVIGYRTDSAPTPTSHVVEVELAHDRLRVELADDRRAPRPIAETGAALALTAGLDALAHRRLDVARQEIARAESLDPKLGSAHLAAGLLALQQNRTEDAIESLRQAVALSPSLPGPDFLLASLYLREGDRDSAWEHALQAYALTGDHRLLDTLAQSGAPPVDVQDRLDAPRVFLRGASMQRLELVGARATDRLLARIGNAIRDDTRLNLASRPGADADLSLLIRAAVDDETGEHDDLDAVLVLTAEGEKPLMEEIGVEDVEDAAAVSGAIDRAVANLAESFCAHRPCG